MEFEYTDYFYVSEDDFNELCDNVKRGMTIQESIDEWATGLDDVDYYKVDNIEDDLAKAIKKKIEEDK